MVYLSSAARIPLPAPLFDLDLDLEPPDSFDRFLNGDYPLLTGDLYLKVLAKFDLCGG